VLGHAKLEQWVNGPILAAWSMALAGMYMIGRIS